MSPLVQEMIEQIDKLSQIQKVQILEHLTGQIECSPVTPHIEPKHKIEDFFGKSPNLTNGMDAQEWVNQLRDEWSDRDEWRTIA